MGNWKGGFKELDIKTLKQVNSLPVKSTGCCVLTFDNKFLVTAEHARNCNLTIWSLRTKKKLDTWQSGVKQYVSS